MTDIDTTAEESALDALLRASIADDEAWHSEPDHLKAKAVWLTAERMEQIGRMTRRDIQVADIKRRPLRAAYRQAIRTIGEHLYAFAGGTEGMRSVLEAVADMDPPRYGYRGTIMDHAWDGIGINGDVWWC